MPAYQKRCNLLHSAGKFVSSHWDGDTKALLPYAQDSGLDAIEAITPKPQGDVTLEEMKQALGDRMFLLDGIPAVFFDPEFSVQQLEDCVYKLIEFALQVGCCRPMASLQSWFLPALKDSWRVVVKRKIEPDASCGPAQFKLAYQNLKELMLCVAQFLRHDDLPMWILIIFDSINLAIYKCLFSLVAIQPKAGQGNTECRAEVTELRRDGLRKRRGGVILA